MIGLRLETCVDGPAKGPGMGVTGPLGHLWSALADMTVIWVRYLAHRARRG